MPSNGPAPPGARSGDMVGRVIQIALVASFTFMVAAAVVFWQVYDEVPEAGGGFARSDVGGAFELLDHNGAEVTEADFAGRLMLIYFGYSFCPDVCPTELARIAAAVDEVDDLVGDLASGGADRLVPVFITIDPERDTPEAIAGYVGLFHDRMVGLTGTAEQVDAAARAFRVYYARVEAEEFADYLMDHSSLVYLQGPDGENLAIFPPGTSAGAMAETAVDILERL